MLDAAGIPFESLGPLGKTLVVMAIWVGVPALAVIYVGLMIAACGWALRAAGRLLIDAHRWATTGVTPAQHRCRESWRDLEREYREQRLRAWNDVERRDLDRRWLANLALGRDGGEGLSGRSAHGGAIGTVFALKLRGLIDAGTGQITESGRAALKVKP